MKLMYVDTETTGLDNEKNQIVQLAGVIEIDGKVVEQFNLFARPTDGAPVSPQALAITGKTIEDLKAYPMRDETFLNFKKIMKRYVNPYEKGDRFVVVGQNVPFDLGFIKAYFKEQGDKWFGSWFSYQSVDLLALSLSARIAGRLDVPNLKLETVCQALGIELKAHDALEDIRATREAFHKMSGWMKESVEV